MQEIAYNGYSMTGLYIPVSCHLPVFVGEKNETNLSVSSKVEQFHHVFHVCLAFV